jgi:hypothetical protein
MTNPNLDDVIEPELDTGLPHDRGAKGGMPPMDDELAARLAEKDRVAAGIDAYDPETVPTADET